MKTPSTPHTPAFEAPLAAQVQVFIDEHREALYQCLEGMSEAEARRPLVPFKTTVLGLVKHAAFVEHVEQVWFNEAISG